MSVTWEDSTSAARVKARAAACASGEFDYTVPTWDIYCDLRNDLITALLFTGFPSRSEWGITEENWEEVYLRLHVYEQVTGPCRVYNNGRAKAREMFFTPAEVKSMIGLRVNAGNKSDLQFRKDLMSVMQREAQGKLDSFLDPSPRDKADPYRWEKLFAPKEMR